MLCENCGKKAATTYIKRVINGIKTEKHLCADCAAALGLNNMPANSLSGLLASMFGDNVGLPVVDSKTCNSCGSAFGDIVKSGKVGCPECYKTFYEELAPYLKRIHGTVKHIGKMPQRSPLVVSTKEDTLLNLRQELSRLVQNEEFEAAAKIRDQIRSIESEGKSNE